MERLERTTTLTTFEQPLHDEPTWAAELGQRMQALSEIETQLSGYGRLHPTTEETLVRLYEGIKSEADTLKLIGRTRGWLA